MPVITIEGPKMSKEQKSDLVKKFTDNASEVLNIPAQAFVINIKENDPDNVGVGGSLLSDLNK